MIYTESDRLVLRSWNEADVTSFVAMNSDARVMKYFPALLSKEETVAFYRRIAAEFENRGFGLYAVELKSTRTFIGYVGLHEFNFEAGEVDAGVEIGWRLAAHYHNQGYATEAARAVLRLAKENGFLRLYSFTTTANKPSERVMQKIGMRKVGEFDHPKLPSDSPLLRHVLYRIDL